MQKGDKVEMNMVLREYKLPNGAVNYQSVMCVPSADRINGLIANGGYKDVHVMLSAGIQVAFENLNLSKPMSANQIVDLADAIIDSSGEDNLGVEDVILFLQKLVRGETDKLFSRLDSSVFMKEFEAYRQNRHAECLRIREEQAAQFKTLGTQTRNIPIVEKDGNIDSKTFFEMLEEVNIEKHDNA
jgi:hypothetical protein